MAKRTVALLVAAFGLCVLSPVILPIRQPSPTWRPNRIATDHNDLAGHLTSFRPPIGGRCAGLTPLGCAPISELSASGIELQAAFRPEFISPDRYNVQCEASLKLLFDSSIHHCYEPFFAFESEANVMALHKAGKPTMWNGSSLRAKRIRKPVFSLRNLLVQQLESRLMLAGDSTPVVVKPVPDIVAKPDVPFQFDLQPAGAVVFGYDVGGRNLNASDNYLASTVRFFKEWEEVTFTNNSIITRNNYRAAMLEEVPSAQLLSDFQWRDNHYVTSEARPFVLGTRSQTANDWLSRTGLDDGSTFVSEPESNHIVVRPNAYEPGRGHAVVYNWQQQSHVDIDLSGVVEVGAAFEISNVLDLKGDPVVAGVYNGGTVSVPMAEVVSPVPLGHQPYAPLLVDQEFSTFLIVSDADPVPPTGNQFYVSTDGTPSGNGSMANPWDLATAFAHPASVQPGDTIWIRDGTYSGRLTSKLTGTAANPITARAEPGATVRLDLNLGSPQVGKLLTIDGQYAHYQGIEVLNSDTSSRTTSTAGSWPLDINRGDFNVLGDHIKIINFEIHDLDNGIGYWSKGDGGEVYGSMIYNNGWIGPDRNHGHAIYSQNTGVLRTFSDNIAFNQFRNGIKIYGSSNAALKNYNLEGNVSFNNGGATGEGFSGTFQYLIGGGSLAEDITFKENHSYVGLRYFSDADVGDTLRYTARQTDGSPLPRWLTFYGSEGFFVGSPTASDVGTIDVELTVSDSSGASVQDVFRITIGSPDESGPSLASLIVDLNLDRGETFEYSMAGNFHSSSPLTYSLTSDETAQPSWLSINSQTGVLHGIAPNDPSTTSATITATDASGSSVSDVFNIVVGNEWADGADLRLSVTSPSAVVRDDAITYAVLVTNDGPDLATGVVLSNALPPGTTLISASDECQFDESDLSCMIGNLAVGDSFELQVIVSAEAIGVMENRVTVSSNSEERNPSNNEQVSQTIVSPPPADLRVAMTTSNRVVAGEQLSLAISINSDGPRPADDIVLTTNLPAGTEFVSATLPCESQQESIRCNIGALDAGETRELTLILGTSQPGSSQISVALASATLDPNLANNLADVSILIVGPGEVSDTIFVSFHTPGVIGGVPYDDEDILAYNETTDQWSLYFDGSKIGLATRDLDAFHIQDDGSLLLSVDNTLRLDGIGLIRDSDILKFTPIAHGTLTAGSLEVYLRGSAVGLSPGTGDIDAISVAPDGRIVISTLGRLRTDNVWADDEDLVVLNNGVFGEQSDGTWELYFDGSELGLSASDVAGTSIDGSNGDVNLTVERTVRVDGEFVEGVDIITYQIGVDDAATRFDGSLLGLTNRMSLDGIQLGRLTGNEVFGNEIIYLSTNSNTRVGGLVAADEDILYHDTRTGAWGVLFDASDLGIRGDVDAFDVLPDSSLLLSFDAKVTLPNVGQVEPADILRFVATSIGEQTSGEFEFYFDGSDVGLSSKTENIDAITLDADGSLLVSTSGNFSVSDIDGRDTDLLRFRPTELGEQTSGSWELFFAGGDAQLERATEDIVGVSMNQTGTLELTTLGQFSTDDSAGTGSDIFQYSDDQIDTTLAIVFAGSDHKLRRSLDGIDVRRFDTVSRPSKQLQAISLVAAAAESLVLGVSAVRTVAGSDQTLKIIADIDDSVDIGSGWQLEEPVVQEGRTIHQLTQNGFVIELDNGRPWHNPALAQDVNGSGRASVLDALTVINRLHSDADSAVPIVFDAVVPTYYDVNDDGFVTAIDALQVINFIGKTAQEKVDGPVDDEWLDDQSFIDGELDTLLTNDSSQPEFDVDEREFGGRTTVDQAITLLF
ncbi:MAG: putative Ig domain-containing protein [Rubripirellula sp.]